MHSNLVSHNVIIGMEPTGAVAKASLHRAIVTAYGPEPGWSIKLLHSKTSFLWLFYEIKILFFCSMLDELVFYAFS